MGYKKQFLSSNIRPIDSSKQVPIMAGRTMTVQEVNVAEEPKTGSPFGKMLSALDDVKKNEIYICAGAGEYATIGELMCTAMLGTANTMCCIAEATEVSPLSVLLCSDYASYITGGNFFVDGGASL